MEDKCTPTPLIGSRSTQLHPKAIVTRHSTSLYIEKAFPDTLISDQAKEETMGQMRKKVQEVGVHYKECEPYSPFQNCVEAGIRELKRAVKRSMVKKSTPMWLRDYRAELQSDIRSSTALDLYALGGMTPETLIKGSIPDISRLVEHEWYDWVKFRDEVPSFPDTYEVLGWWLGPFN